MIRIKGHFFETTKDECCCCQIDDYNEMSRSWTNKTDCQNPLKCCNIPTKEECEIKLNPTFDGSCGHLNEEKYQKANNGSKPQEIYRNGEKYVMKGWLGQRLYDTNLNIIEEWCIDNGRADSFFLWRFVHCNGDYPNWFARCVFPSATNTLIYKGCNSNDFKYTIPNCFGELEEMNIGLGDDFGHDVDYRYDVDEETLYIWCTNHSIPKDPLYNIQYKGKAPAENDGVVPFYLSQCREAYNRNDIYDNRLLKDYYNYYHYNSNQINKKMSSLTFRMNLMINKINHYFFQIIINGNSMPLGYEAIIQYNDSISFNILNKQIFIINQLYIDSIHNQDWIYNIDFKQQYVTFIYVNKHKQITLHYNTNITLCILEVTNNYNNSKKIILRKILILDGLLDPIIKMDLLLDLVNYYCKNK